jgi:DNA polymerase-3 subunit epsilon
VKRRQTEQDDAVSTTRTTIEHLGRQLAARLALIRPLVCLDLEATGVRVDDDRIVQIAAATIFPAGVVTTWSSLVNPEQPIPAAATAVHGISDAMVASAPTLAQLAPDIAALLAGRDLTGYNVERFDRRLLAAEFCRIGLEDPTAAAHVIDAYTIFVRQESRSLDAALRFYGVQVPAHRQAHEANSDVEAAVAVLLAQLNTYDDVPTSVNGLHDWLCPRDPNRIERADSLPGDLRRFVDEERWTDAKTMPDWPHEYLVRDRVDRGLFERLVRHIRSNGYEGRFYQKAITYYDEAGLVYWTMGAPLDATIVINRCRKEATFAYRALNGELPVSEGWEGSG